uniref:C-type lectin domain-containing protein n=1 Tax=Cyprinus carpio TaxID=7962 RepID=A0A8C2PMI5_CYPCA
VKVLIFLFFFFVFLFLTVVWSFPPAKCVLVNDRKTWTGAQSYCREKCTDLVSVRNEAERQQILSIYSTDVWIGLHRNRLWSDQSSSSDAAQPDNIRRQIGVPCCTAVSLQHFGRWTDERCLASLPFFCYSGELIYLL